jgi:hypothetical protein
MSKSARKSKSKVSNTNLDEKQEERTVERREAERVRTTDLNQGLDTGTHDSVRHGVNWGTADGGRTVISPKQTADETPAHLESEADSEDVK